MLREFTNDRGHSTEEKTLQKQQKDLQYYIPDK